LSAPVLRLEGLEWKEMEWTMRCELVFICGGVVRKERGYLEYGTDFKMCRSEKSVVHESAICK